MSTGAGRSEAHVSGGRPGGGSGALAIGDAIGGAASGAHVLYTSGGLLADVAGGIPVILDTRSGSENGDFHVYIGNQGQFKVISGISPSETDILTLDETDGLVVELITLASNPAAAVSGAGEVAIRSNAGVFEVSQNGGAWGPLSASLTVGSSPIGSGSAGRVLFESAANQLAENAALTFDAATTTFTANGLATTPTTVSITQSPASSNTVVDLLSLVRTNSSSTGAIGIGAATTWTIENASSANVLAARQSIYLTNVTSGSEASLMEFYTLASGALALSGTIGGSAGARGFYAPDRFIIGTTTSTKWGALVSGSQATYVSAGGGSGCFGHSFNATSGSVSGVLPILKVTQSANTGQTASTEAPGVLFDLSATITWATGALANQRFFKIMAPTIAFAGASTVTKCSTLNVSGPPIAGANATLTVAYAAEFGGIIRVDGAMPMDGAAAAATLGTLPTGGTGAQMEWIRMDTQNGPRVVPAWAIP